MSFGLKKCWDNISKAMVTFFCDMIHKEIEVCVDNMITESRRSCDSFVEIVQAFEEVQIEQLLGKGELKWILTNSIHILPVSQSSNCCTKINQQNEIMIVKRPSRKSSYICKVPTGVINALQLAQAEQLIIFKRDEEGKGNEVTYPMKSERKARRLKIMRYLGLAAPVETYNKVSSTDMVNKPNDSRKSNQPQE
ncbi:hypothetical protein CR513_25865, partial [Mucuna pruriens]